MGNMVHNLKPFTSTVVRDRTRKAKKNKGINGMCRSSPTKHSLPAASWSNDDGCAPELSSRTSLLLRSHCAQCHATDLATVRMAMDRHNWPYRKLKYADSPQCKLLSLLLWIIESGNRSVSRRGEEANQCHQDCTNCEAESAIERKADSYCSMMVARIPDDTTTRSDIFLPLSQIVRWADQG